MISFIRERPSGSRKTIVNAKPPSSPTISGRTQSPPPVRRVRVENLIPRFNYNVSVGFVSGTNGRTATRTQTFRPRHFRIVGNTRATGSCCSCIRRQWPVTTKGLDRELDESPASSVLRLSSSLNCRRIRWCTGFRRNYQGGPHTGAMGNEQLATGLSFDYPRENQ